MKYSMPEGLNRKKVHVLRIITASVVTLTAFLTFEALNFEEYKMAALMAVICLLNMNGFKNFTKILQANPK